MHLLTLLTDPIHTIKLAGLIGVVAIVFAESGLLIGFFLPGDSLLFTAGLLASQHHLNLPALLICSIIAAVAGDNVGYAFGQKIGPALFNRPDSRFFSQKRLVQAHEFYERHGSKTIILARFMPVVRTFAPILAGVAKMKYREFVTYNVIGGLAWVSSMILGGYVLGRVIPNVDDYILPIVLLIIFVSIAPGIYHLLRAKFTKMPR